MVNSATKGNCVLLAVFPFETCNFGVFDELFSFKLRFARKSSKLLGTVKSTGVELKFDALDPIKKKLFSQ